MATERVFVVSWQYPGGEVFSYPVQMTDAQARRAERFLRQFIGTGYLKRANVVLTAEKPLSVGELTQVFREEFPRAEKEWTP
jgi:hypothetical protein